MVSFSSEMQEASFLYFTFFFTKGGEWVEICKKVRESAGWEQQGAGNRNSE